MLRADLPADERRWLVLDADAVLGLDLHRVWDARAVRRRSPPRSRRSFASETTHASLATMPARTRLRDEIGAAGFDVIDGPDGSAARRR
jgi:hypothetical protein